MGGINLSLHPLFFCYGLYNALTGRFIVFVIYTLSALAHEIGHSLVSAKCGYRLNEIVLMPFGAVAKGDIDGLRLVDQIKIALAGPFLSLAIGLFFIALWWIIPDTYAFTDVVAEANLSMALVNFLPVFPLDGGRVLSAFSTIKFGKTRGKIICRISGVFFSLALLALFFITLKTPNYSLLFFSAFVLFGTFGKGSKVNYVKKYSGVSTARLKRGMDVKRQAVDKSVSVKKLISLLDENAINEIVVFDNETQITTLSQENITRLILTANIYDKVGDYLAKFK